MFVQKFKTKTDNPVTIFNQFHIHRTLVLRPLILRLITLTPLANLRHFLILYHFRFNALRLAVFYCAEPSFLAGISYFIYAFFIYAHFFFFWNATRV
jgi:hypothetical protein